MIKETYIQSLKHSITILRDFAEKMTPEEIQYRVRDFWTIGEHIEHLADTQTIMLERMKQFAAEEHPAMVPFVPSDERKTFRSVEEALSEYSSVRHAQIELLESLDDSCFQRKADHPHYKRFTLDILVRHAISHDGIHLWRMEELWNLPEDKITEMP